MTTETYNYFRHKLTAVNSAQSHQYKYINKN